MPAMLKDDEMTSITVETLMKGTIDVPEQDVITFSQALLGFEQRHRYIILQTQPGPLYWLQSIEDPRLAFCLLAPFETNLDPDFEIGRQEVEDLQASGATEITVYTMVVLDRDPQQMRTNLRAPLLVCRRTGLGKQVVFTDERLSVQFFLKDIPQAKAKSR